MLYLHDEIAPYARWGMKTYVPYETHWTGLGAYFGYAALMRDHDPVGACGHPAAVLREHVRFVRGY